MLSVAEIDGFFSREFPQVDRRAYVLEEAGPLTARMRLVVSHEHLRPGATVSGPAMMTLADLAMYAAILASIGPVAQAVTTNLSFNFLRRPPARDLLAECRLLKLGRQLAMGEVALRGEGGADVVCHATGTYAIPSGSGSGIQTPIVGAS